MDKIVESILKLEGKQPSDIAINSRDAKISYYDLLKALLATNNLVEASTMLPCSNRTLERYLPKIFPGKPRGRPWKYHFPILLGSKECNVCKQTKVLEDFYSEDGKLGKIYKPACISCTRIEQKDYYLNNKHLFRGYDAKRRAIKLNASPKWSNALKIEEIYSNCPEGYQVDHIIPLINDLVCGLHVETNLQYLTKKENTEKSNRFNPDDFEVIYCM